MSSLAGSLLAQRSTFWEAALRGAVLALAALVYRRWLLGSGTARRRRVLDAPPRDVLRPTLDLRRRAAIAKGQAIDHGGAVVEFEDPEFSLDATIFASVAKQANIVVTTMLRKQLARVPYWSDEAAAALNAMPLPAPPPVDRRITDFMLNECNFKLEHADGSFMDHVVFCHDYCASHYKAQSPRVLLLHSILGVGTNIFPMKVELVSKLAELLSEGEMRHVEAFPSVLRLLVAGELLADLRGRLGSLDKLERVSFRRVIDNKAIELSAAEFWVHLNYHVIHWLDFLPVADWGARLSEPLFQSFLELRSFLVAANQLQATVGLGSTCGEVPEAQLLQRAASSSPMFLIKRGATRKTIRKYSAEIGHSLDYTLHWAN